jgi:putative peptide zinc metalloprotease protein
MIGHPRTALRSSSATAQLALAAIPQGGVTAAHPAFFLLPDGSGDRTTALAVGGSGNSSPAAAFPFRLPAKPGPGDTQALAVGTRDGGVVYDISYALVTVDDGAPVTNTNSAFAFAHCQGCTTVAVSFQVVLVIGQSDTIAPINAAGALNVDCPACMTVAVADQIVVTLSQQPSAEVMAKLKAALAKLNALPALGADVTPDEVVAQVAAVQKQVETTLNDSGLETGGSVGSNSTESSGGSSAAPSGAVATGGSATSSAASTSSAPATSSAAPTSTADTSSAGPTTESSDATPSSSSTP